MDVRASVEPYGYLIPLTHTKVPFCADCFEDEWCNPEPVLRYDSEKGYECWDCGTIFAGPSRPGPEYPDTAVGPCGPVSIDIDGEGEGLGALPTEPVAYLCYVPNYASSVSDDGAYLVHPHCLSRPDVDPDPTPIYETPTGRCVECEEAF